MGWTIYVFLAAFPLFSFNLASPFLYEQESLVAQMAKEMVNNNFLLGRWLFPTLWGEFYPQQLIQPLAQILRNKVPPHKVVLLI